MNSFCGKFTYQIQKVSHGDIFAFGKFDTSIGRFVPEARAQDAFLHVVLQFKHRI